MSNDGTESAFLHKYDMGSPHTKVWCEEQQQVLHIKEYMKKHAAEATSVYGYTPFKAGSCPKNLVEMKDICAKITDPLLKLLLEMAALDSAPILWVMKYSGEKKCIEPSGLALVNATQWSLPAGQTHELSA